MHATIEQPLLVNAKHNVRRNQEMHCKFVLVIASTHEMCNGFKLRVNVAMQQQEEHNNKFTMKIIQSTFSFVVQKENDNHCSMKIDD